MTKLLAQKDRPLVRAMGFLYLRYVLKPELLWRYCEDVLIDDGRAILEEGRKETLGEWLRGVLTSQQYHGTQLPRIPTKIDRDIRARVDLVDEGNIFGNSAYDGTYQMHKNFTDCIKNKEIPITDIRDVISSFKLISILEGK